MSLQATGVIIAGTQSSSGKTAITCMLLSALQHRGLLTQPFKVGPDFIDPTYHQVYSDAPSINLDAWLMSQAEIQANVEQTTFGKIGVIEGVMGLFDGMHPQSNAGSTFELATELGWPIVLVVSGEKAGRSLGASIYGFLELAGKERILGVILNQVSSENHGNYLQEALTSFQISLLGVIPKDKQIQWPERHLGLQARSEIQLPSSLELATLAENTIDLDQLLTKLTPPTLQKKKQTNRPPITQKIAVAQDEAFHFYYANNLEFLRQHGTEIIPVSPVHDSSLPTEIDGLILGGGFPEIFIERLASNHSFLQDMKHLIKAGMPCYAECGGLMLLADSFINLQGEKYSLAGVIPGNIRMTDRLQHFGYCTAHLPQSDRLSYGHEFHYSYWDRENELANLWLVEKKYRKTKRREGYQFANLHASYVHLYFPQSPHLFRSFFQSENL